METRQRHANPAIPPWTEDWSERRQLGFGFVATIPLALLGATFFAWILSAANVGVPFTRDVMPLLLYTHVGATFITLLVFGHLMVANPHLNAGGKVVWAMAFLMAAPVAMPIYWLVHVRHERSRRATDAKTTSQVHIYDYDYTPGHAEGTARLPDGTLVHHVDAGA